MSNLTPDDVDLRLTASKAELSEEDQRLWLGLEDEKISRIAGDEANKQFTELVKQQNSGTESRLSTEVIHRSEGDVSNLNSLNAVAQALSDYRIKTDLEINNEVIARKALGVELNSRIDSFVSTWDHQKYLTYQAIQDVQDDIDGKYSSMDSRIKKYEDMLQDITTDSIQITMDNGEINMGAWTILSQAREWDLQIIAKMKDYQLAATGDLNQALEDMQNKLPVEQNIIDKAIQGLSNSQVIKDLDEKLTSNIADINNVNQNLLGEVTNRQNEMIAQAQNTANAIKNQADELTAAVIAETAARIDAVTREADIRTLQIEGINSSISEETEERIEEIRLLNDGLTAEVNSRVEGDQNITTALDNYKESNDAALANVRNTVEVLVSDTTVMSQTVSSLDARLTVTEADTATANSLAASANEKANTALTATTSLAERMESVEASIETVQGDLTNKVDVIAFNSLKTEVTAIDGRVTTNTANIASITGNITDISSQLTANTAAISELSTEQTQQGNDIEQVSSQITQLSADIDSVQDAVVNKADASAVASLTTQVNQQGENITLINSDVTTLKGSLSTVEGNLASKADSTALNSLSSKVTAVDDKVSSHSGQITALNASIDNISVGGANLLKNSEGVFTPNMSSTDNYVIYHSSTVDMVNGKEYTLSGETNGEWSSEYNADAESNKAVLWLVGNGLNIVISDSSVGTKGRTFVWGNPSGTYVLRLNSYRADNSIWFKNIKIESGNKRTDWTPATSDNASAAALSTLDTKVTGIDGKVTTNSNSITTLSGKITAVENGLTTKADGSALSALTTRVSNTEGELSSQSSKVTKLETSVGNTISHIIATFRNGNYRSGGIDAGVYTPKLVMEGGFSRGMNLIVWAADGTLGSIQGFDTLATSAAVADLAAAVLALPTNTYFTLVGVDNVGNSSAFQSNADLKNFVLANGGSSDYYSTWGVTSLPIFTSMVGTGSATGIQHSFNSNVSNDWIKYLITFIGGIPEGMSGTQRIDESKFATASALSTLDSKVTSIDGRVTANASSITNLQAGLTTANNNIATKADGSALTALTTRVSNAEGALESQSNQITSLTASLNNLKVGGTNLLAKSKMTNGYVESGTGVDGTNATHLRFKTPEVLGTYRTVIFSTSNTAVILNVYPFVGTTYKGRIVLTRGVPYTFNSDVTSYKVEVDGAAGNVENITNYKLQLEYGTIPTDWSPAPEDTASAAALSTLDTKVTTVDGKVTSQASSITQLQADVAANSSKLIVQGEVVDGLKATYVVKTDVNGLVTSYGLYNENGVGAFGVNADYFYVGKGTAATNGKKPFMVLTTTQTISGVTYPAGTWIDVALIANATIGTAHIANAAITNAKIADATIESAKIKSIKADKIEVGNPLVGPITPSMVTGTSLINAANLFNGYAAANGSYASYGTGTQSATSGAETNYIQVDVGSTVSMPEVRFFFRGSTGRKTYIKLKASVDGTNWDYIMGSTSKWETIDDMPPGPNSDYSTVTVQAAFSWYGVKPYRYLRIYGNGSSASAANELVAIIGNASGNVTKIGSEGILTGSITADKIQVDDLSAISADLGTIKVGSANIADLAVDTLHIKDNAVTVPAATTLLTPIKRTTNRQPTTFAGGVTALVDSSNYFGDILSLTIDRKGGKCRVEGSIWMDKIYGVLSNSSGSKIPTGEQYIGVMVFKNGTLLSWARVPTSFKDTNQAREHSGVAAIPVVIDDPGVGLTTYSIRLGLTSDRTDSGTMMGVFSGSPTIVSATLAVMELKK